MKKEVGTLSMNLLIKINGASIAKANPRYPNMTDLVSVKEEGIVLPTIE